MADRNKVVILVAAHCAPKVLKMTLGTWLDKWDRSYDAEVYVSVHNNYHHYHPGMAEIMEMEPFIKVVQVDEMNWGKYPLWTVESILRYSEAHMTNVLRLMDEAAKGTPDFTHVAVLDHDLVFKEDFVGWAAGKGSDLVCSLFEDRYEDKVVKMGIGVEIPFAPKPSVWHLVMSRKLAQIVSKMPHLLLPGVKNGKCFDSMSLLYHDAVDMMMDISLVPETYLRRMVEHIWSMSFNYGPLLSSNEEYWKRLGECEVEYDKMFPEGIGKLLEKLRR